MMIVMKAMMMDNRVIYHESTSRNPEYIDKNPGEIHYHKIALCYCIFQSMTKICIQSSGKKLGEI